MKTLRNCVYTNRIREKLEGIIEMDETYVKAGQKGKKCFPRSARKRALKQKGRGTYAKTRGI